MKRKWKNLILFFYLLSLLSLNGCATTPEVIYKYELPSGYVAIKQETLSKLVDELIFTRHQLLECWEKLRKE